jgi:hypothetical protein
MRILIVLSVGIIARHSFQGGGATIGSPPSFTSPAIGISRKTSTSRWGLGYDYLAEVWNEYRPDELDEDFGALLMTLSFFTSPKLAEAYHQDTKGKGSLEQFAKTVIEIFPDAMREYAHLGRSIYQTRLETGDLDSHRQALGRPDAMIPVHAAAGKSLRSAVAQRKEQVLTRSSTDMPCC